MNKSVGHECQFTHSGTPSSFLCKQDSKKKKKNIRLSLLHNKGRRNRIVSHWNKSTCDRFFSRPALPVYLLLLLCRLKMRANHRWNELKCHQSIRLTFHAYPNWLSWIHRWLAPAVHNRNVQMVPLATDARILAPKVRNKRATKSRLTC